jgi:hypothetical protein
MFEVFEKVGLLDGDFMVSAHHFHGCSLSCFDIADEMDGAEVAAADLLQLLVFLHHAI